MLVLTQERLAMRNARHLAAIFIALAAWTNALALTFEFSYIDDANGTFASRGWLDFDSLFQRDIRAAANLWAARIDSDETIVVDIDPYSFSARAGGTNSLGRYLYTNDDGKEVWEFGPLTRILTGSNPGETFFGYDILLGFDAEFVEDYYWFDPQPELRTTPVPGDKGDFVSVVMHELGHGWGYTGFRDFPTGQILGTTATQLDDKSYFGGDGEPVAQDGSRNPMFFRGDYAASLYGSDLHLTHKPPGDPLHGQNYFHLSACESGSPDGLEGTLMNGCVLPNGERLEITPFDSAVLADLGYPIIVPTGDYSENGFVDAADYVAWRKLLGQVGVGLAADGNLNNQIDLADYSFWRTRFGQVGESGFGQSPEAAPEPSGVAIGLVALVGWSIALGRFPRALFGQH
jgi:hypothetical protein